MKTIRIFFKKQGRAKYISHLDLQRCMQRSLKRSGLPVWYTEGFHPHIYLTFALPLSLGYESLCESVDCKLTQDCTEEEILQKLSGALPEGLEAYAVGEPQMKPTEIAWAQYEINVHLPDGDKAAIEAAFEAFLSLSEILVEKTTKKGKKEIDLKPSFTIKAWEASDKLLSFTAMVASGSEGNINPALIVDAFCEQAGITSDGLDVLRQQVYTEKFMIFA